MISVGDRVWLCLRFERLALEIFADRDDRKAIAVVEQRRIHVANRDVLEPGMALNTAFALCPGLLALERQPAREAQALEQLAHWAYQITPEIVLAEDNSLLLEIGGCRRLHGDLPRLLRRVAASLVRRGHTVRQGVAHTPRAAWLMARLARPPALAGNRLDAALLERQLLDAPVVALPIETRPRQALIKMGLTGLDAVLRLPQAALRKRLGAEVLRYLNRLTGQHPDPQPPFVPQPVFDQDIAFIDGIIHRQTLLFPMKRLVLSLCDYLAARQLRCRALRWRFYDARQLRAEMTLELSQAHNRWRSLLELSQLKLESVALPEAVFTLALHSDSFFAMEQASLGLFEDDALTDNALPGRAHNDEAGHALIDRLSSRLGAAALQRLEACESLWPEQASRLVPVNSRLTPASPPSAERPAWLLPRPVPLRMRGEQPCWRSALELMRGPERISGPVGHGHERQRDYYVAREEDGQLCWIFREVSSRRWFAHGIFS